MLANSELNEQANSAWNRIADFWNERMGGAFRAGLVLDALEEAAFPPDHETGSGPNPWGGAFSEFPAVLLGRFVPGGARRG